MMTVDDRSTATEGRVCSTSADGFRLWLLYNAFSCADAHTRTSFLLFPLSASPCPRRMRCSFIWLSLTMQRVL